ncbi:helicase-related protein [Hoeflea poritis]|uniref:Helicase-related protein n=1 Tax=Hoeflea poritis TaxID=2993659 RepID=A0ABT4VLU4_9HYPH|nr:helicase-related protein [Hoeflea poritis]MDA4845688.1 helicase-related protein [Hoeflea poritis]
MRQNSISQNQPLVLSGRGVTAVLGPTNTGKTHYAIERMVAHRSGVIGLPLRLLAREVYERICVKVGSANVALVTGEEKIGPKDARYAVCTVEAMPKETDAEFVAIDEVQLAGDLERGHVFTDRILHLRGREETLLLGAATIRGILEKLLPGLTVVSRPRLSHLAYAGSKKITRLPRRSAIVAFSADEVYAVAELIRRQRGGAAVVLGALSPRTRNAQVALYQQGDVEYLVATDAIGMGLNLDVDHVAFAQDRKFDGYQFRSLNPAEIGQIAGRAGRHMHDGTFGVTGRVDPFGEELVERVEAHEFEPLKVLQWRSKQLDFSSVPALCASLDEAPRLAGLSRALPAVDRQALDHLARDADVGGLATDRQSVERLWDVCALPDYRKITPAQHADLIATIYGDIIRHGSVREDYVAEQVRRADRTDGEIDTLSARISQIRTWTYASHRPGWLANPSHWQEKTREIEDRLSDALHERLTKRFVDRRTSVLMKRLRENAMLEAEIGVDGDVFVEGHHVGQLNGFRFTPDANAEGPDAKAVLAAAQKSLALEFEARAARLHASGNGDFALGSDGFVRWLGDPVARLTESDEALKPRTLLLADEQLSQQARDVINARIERFVGFHISSILKPLEDLATAEDLEGLSKGLAFRLVEGFGILFRRDVAADVKALDQDARGSLRRYGVRFGAYHVFMPALLKPAPAELITLLWSLRNDGFDKPGYGEITGALAAGRTSIVTDPTFEREFYRLAGFRFLGKRAVRIDILERLADIIRPLLQWKPETGPRPDGAYDGRRFVTTPAMLSILGATPDDIEEILKGLGYRADEASAEDVAVHFAELDAKAAESGEKADEAAKPDETAQAAADAQPEKTADDAVSDNEQPQAEAQEASEQKAAEKPAEAEAPAADGASDAAQSGGEQAAPEAGSEEQGEPEPPKPVLLWRPAGRSDGNRGRGRHQQPHKQGAGRGKNRGHQRDGERGGYKGKGGFKGKPNKSGKAGGFSARPPRKDKPVDPDSPFAKLAALKEQLNK